MITVGELALIILLLSSILIIGLQSVSPDTLKKIIFTLIMMNALAIMVIVIRLTDK